MNKCECILTSSDYFLECYGRMAVNSFHVMDENQVGQLANPNHCLPAWFSGTEMWYLINEHLDAGFRLGWVDSELGVSP